MTGFRFPPFVSLHNENRKLFLQPIDNINRNKFPMEETIRKPYGIARDTKSKVGNHKQWLGFKSTIVTQIRTVIDGFLGVSSWFPKQQKSFLIRMQETFALKIGNLFHNALKLLKIQGFLHIAKFPKVSTLGNIGFPRCFLMVS